MKILVLHQFYLMPEFSGGSRFNEFARFWAEAGHEVTVIAGNLDHHTGTSPERYRGKLVVKEQDGPVTVYRCHVAASYTKNYLRRALGYLGFGASSALALLRSERPDVIIATSPPLTIVLSGLLAGHVRHRGVPWIFEMRDLWPESAVATGVLNAESPITKCLYGLEAFGARKSAAINVLTPAFREDLIARGLAKKDNIVFVPNGADTEHFIPGPKAGRIRKERGWGKRFVVLYAGAHGRANAVGQLLDAAALLREREDIVIATVGGGPEWEDLERRVQKESLSNVDLCGPQAKADMPAYVQACDVGAAVLQDNETFKTVYPNKVFDYMACSRPTLLAIDGVARTLVCDQARAGVFAPPENPEALAKAILDLADNKRRNSAMGRRGRAFVEAEFSRKALAERYLDIMKDLSGGADGI